MAAVLASMPDLCNRTLAEHVPDSMGRCIACRDDFGTQAQWPCLTYTVAKQAREIHDNPPVPAARVGRHAR